MNATVLAGVMRANIEAVQAQTPEQPISLQEMCQAMAEAVVQHIQTSATVQVTGVQLGGGVAVGTVS